MACGPSAYAFDLRRLAGKRVIAVNNAVDLLGFGSYLLRTPDIAAAVFSLDSEWVYRRRVFLESFPGERYAALPLESFPECAGIPGVTYLRHSENQGLSDDPSAVSGKFSGHGALNLAYLQGAREIHLVGFDMDSREGEKFVKWIPTFRDALPQLNNRGVRVINHNLASCVDAFLKEA